MKITDTAIDRRTTVMVVLLLILVMGVYSAITLPIESEPEIIIPIASVSVIYTGVSPQDMETLVTSPIERKLTGISGVKQIQSVTTEGFANIMVEFDADVDVDSAIQKVRDKVELAKSELPEDAEDPIVRDSNMAESPVIFVTLTGPMSVAELTQIAEDLEDRIESLDGIIEVLVTEGRIELRNFGVFEVRERKPRKARNPRTGKEVDVAAKRVATFKPGKMMEERIAAINKPFSWEGQAAPSTRPAIRPATGSAPAESASSSSAG